MNPFFHSILAATQEVKDVTAIGETLAYTWFGRPNYAYSAEAQKYWIGSTKDTPSGTTQHVTEYDLNNDSYNTYQVGTVYEKDDHNQAQILIRKSDNRLMAFYTEHNGAALRWKISTNPLDASSWGSEITLNPFSAYSYLSPYQVSNGDIFIFYRTKPTTTATWYYQKSTDGGLTFGTAVKLYEETETQNYMISVQDGDKIHFTTSNGHPQTNSDLNINVYHFYFDASDETFRKSDGTIISEPLDTTKVTPVALFSGDDTSWILDIATKNGLPRILYTKYPNGRINNTQIKELWFVEWDGTSWVNNQKISETLNGYIEDDATIDEEAYSGASRFDVSNPDIIWMPKEVNGILEIHKVDISINPIYIEQLTFDSTVNNWRPISVPTSVNNLLWLKNNYYNTYTDYSISLQTKTV